MDNGHRSFLFSRRRQVTDRTCEMGGGAAENSRQAFAVVQLFLGKVEHDVDGVAHSSAADRSA
jgi:hypothetical protein